MLVDPLALTWTTPFPGPQEFADQHGICFFETSAKENQNVEVAFLDLTRDIKKHMGAKAISATPAQGTANLKPGQNIAAGNDQGCKC